MLRFGLSIAYDSELYHLVLYLHVMNMFLSLVYFVLFVIV